MCWLSRIKAQRTPPPSSTPSRNGWLNVEAQPDIIYRVAKLESVTADLDRMPEPVRAHRDQLAVRRGPESRAAELATMLIERSEEFRELWARHEVGLRPQATKSFVHPTVGRLDLTCQTLVDPDQGHLLLVYTAVPGSESHERLELLSVLGPDEVTLPAESR